MSERLRGSLSHRLTLSSPFLILRLLAITHHWTAILSRGFDFAMTPPRIAAGGPCVGTRHAFAACAVVMAALLTPLAAEAGIRAVWAVHDGLGLERDDLKNAAMSGNSVWDGRSVRIVGARNEIVAFQVIVQADEQGIDALTVALPSLAGSKAGEVIRYRAPEPDPTLTVDLPIRIYSLHYMKVTRESHAEWVWEPGSEAAPADTLGWKPVQIVPENARAERGGFPLRVRPNQNQSIFIEIYTGHGRPAGLYKGTITVNADGRTRRVPIALEVLDFALPDRPTLPVMVYFEKSEVELYQGRDLSAAYHRFAHAHRVELVHAYTPELVEQQAGRFDGRAFSREAGYEGPGEGVGNRIVPASFYGPRAFATRDGWPQADSWVTFLQRTLPGALSFVYLPDEPKPDRFPEVRRIAQTVHDNPGPGGRLLTFLTRRIEPALKGVIDIWCSPPQALDLAAAAAEQKEGHQVWVYNHGRPNGPSLVIDAPPTDGRVVGWAAFKHRLDGYFFWHGVHWRHNSQKQGERNQNVWAEPVTFDNRGQPNKRDFGYINGDGVLMYPGEEKLHPEEDRGIAGPIDSLQFANLRRGLQDYEYLALARRLGLDDLVSESLQAIVPRVFSDAGERVGFSEDGDAFERARIRLGRAIAAHADAPR